MDYKSRSVKINMNMEEHMELKKGPWTTEEDLKLVNYISTYGEGRWNSLAWCAGLKRTGKSCRLRWLNYLRPNVRRGDITLEEQLLILQLHFRWGNRWSKIAQYLPGRTDNEIKNYWRTRVQKQAKHLRCNVNSQQFRDAMKYLWIPRLIERIQAVSTSTSIGISTTSSCATTTSSDQFMINSYGDGINNITNMEHLGLISNPNGYITPENYSKAVALASDIMADAKPIETSFHMDHQSLVGSEMSSPDNKGLLKGDLTAMQDESYLNWFENVNEMMMPSCSDSFWNIESDEDFRLLL